MIERMQPSFTEAARRAIDRAADLAERAGAAEAEPLHLLWALAEQESHAAETLQRFGLTRELLENECPLAFDASASNATDRLVNQFFQSYLPQT